MSESLAGGHKNCVVKDLQDKAKLVIRVFTPCVDKVGTYLHKPWAPSFSSAHQTLISNATDTGLSADGKVPWPKPRAAALLGPALGAVHLPGVN
jgi:hypothetical protein